MLVSLFYWTGLIVWFLVCSFIVFILFLILCRVIMSLDYSIRVELALERAKIRPFSWKICFKRMWWVFKHAHNQTCAIISKTGEEVPWNLFAYKPDPKDDSEYYAEYDDNDDKEKNDETRQPS